MAENIFPYELPENWHWSTLKSVIKLISGRDVPLSKCNDQKKGIPYVIGASNFSNGKFLIERWIEIPVVTSEKNDILISVKGTIGKIYFQIEEKLNISRQIMAIRPIKTMHSKYFFWFFIFMSDELRVSGNGMIPGISRSKILEMPIPLPPLDEQKRIVAIIESLFEKLDAAKSIVQKILDGYELRRAAILHKAFTGELTKNFRADSGLTLDDWQEKKLGEVLNLSKKKTDSFNENLKYVGLENISKDNGTINFQSAKDIKSTKNIFHGGDLLYGKLRPYLNKHGIPNFDGVCSTDILVLNANELSTNEFINYFFSLPTFVEYTVSNSKGINLPRVSAQIILQAEINLPPLDEQKEVVRVLDSLLDKEQRTKEIAEKILSEIDWLKRTILARAFRGELGTSNPSEKLEGL